MTNETAVSSNIVKDYIAITKPRVMSLLLITALGGMFLATKGVPDLYYIALVLICGSMASGGASAINQGLDKELDKQMTRTSTRPVVAGRIKPHQALFFGVSLNVIAFVALSVLVNPLSGILTIIATFIYVFVYTIGLKRKTSQNIVIGGAAGSIPPMIGWAAITNQIEVPAIFLFAIIFLWTPPHFWALALILKDDYTKAQVPMLPVIVGIESTKRHILVYTFSVVALTLIFASTTSVGWIYFGFAVGLGSVFIIYALRLVKLPDIEGAKALFICSTIYLALLFVGIMIDSSVSI